MIDEVQKLKHEIIYLKMANNLLRHRLKKYITSKKRVQRNVSINTK